MTGKELARRLETPPFVQYANQLLAEKGDGFKEFFLDVIHDLKSDRLATSEIKLQDLRQVLPQAYPPEIVDRWLPDIEKALRNLGRYASDDDIYPWVSGVGDCPNCRDYADSSTSDERSVRVCTACGRRFWQYNRGQWRQITDPQEWDAVRFQAIHKRKLDVVRVELESRGS